jgi:hypothetical protein
VEAIKYCPGCGQTKKVREFGKDKGSVDGFYTYCLDCDRKKQREGYQMKQILEDGDTQTLRLMREKKIIRDTKATIIQVKELMPEVNRMLKEIYPDFSGNFDVLTAQHLVNQEVGAWELHFVLSVDGLRAVSRTFVHGADIS